MLVLERRVGEAIQVGDEIIITIVAVQSGKVRIGIEAPKEVPVHREEVYKALNAPVKRIPKPVPKPG